MKKLIFCAALLLCARPAFAGYVVGLGNVDGTWHDSAWDIIAVDLNAPTALTAGSYLASSFNYAFNPTVVGGDTSLLNGTITPILLVGSGTNYTPIAVGDTITYNGPTGFISTSFGGTDTFMLGADQTVYGGLYWHDLGGGSNDRMPIGYVNFTGNDFVVYGGGFGPGALAPVVGTQISGSAEGFFNRQYQFSINIESAVTPVPAPPAFVLALTGAGLLSVAWVRRKRLTQPL